MEAPATAGTSGATTRVARGLIVTQCVLTVLALLPPTKRVMQIQLALVPYRALARLRLWALLTCGLFDTRPVAALLNVATTALCARPAELALGRSNLVAMLVLSTATAATVVSTSALAVYAAIRVYSFIFAPIATAAGVNLALLVALKQQISEHEVGVGSVRLRVNYAPLAYAVMLFVLACADQLGFGALMLAYLSAHAAWAFLRYWRRNPMTGELGDPSDSFAFATFFPDPIRPFVAVVANVLHLMCTPVLNWFLSIGTSPPSSNGVKQELVNSIVQDHSSAIDAERRRQRAMKTLDERIAGSQSEPAL